MKRPLDRIWETRRARIKMETRLATNARVGDFLLPWYSLSLIVITLLPPNGRQSTVYPVSVAASIAILVISVLLSSTNLRVRALEVRNQYVELDRIHEEMLATESDKAKQSQLFERYSDLLRSTPNDSTRDYLLVKIEYRKSTDSTLDKPTFSDFLRVGAGTVAFWGRVVALFIAPPVLIWLILR